MVLSAPDASTLLGRGNSMRKILTTMLATAAGLTITSQAAAAETCVAGPFMIFFDTDTDTVTEQGAAILDNVADAYQSCGQAQVMIAGHTDRARAADYNVGLSQRMAANVRSYLAGHAIPDGVITVEAFGESRPLVETADEVREPMNRRVEITFGPGSGW
jgi:OOP family OmpA-OmpF porin